MSGRPRMTPAALSALCEGGLANFVAAATPGGIEAQERRGQQILAVSEFLPKEIRGGTRAAMERMGFQFGEDADDLFCRATLPPGWQKVGTDHAMHSRLLDDQGRERASIFYKAAFYDRRADMELSRRFSVEGYRPCDAQGNEASYDKATHMATVITDSGNPVRTIGLREKDARAARDEHYRAAVAWLNEHWPEWKSATAYWGE